MGVKFSRTEPTPMVMMNDHQVARERPQDLLQSSSRDRTDVFPLHPDALPATKPTSSGALFVWAVAVVVIVAAAAVGFFSQVEETSVAHALGYGVGAVIFSLVPGLIIGARNRWTGGVVAMAFGLLSLFALWSINADDLENGMSPQQIEGVSTTSFVTEVPPVVQGLEP